MIQKRILGAFQAGTFFDNWIGFFFLSLLGKYHQTLHILFIEYASKTKIANSSKIYVQIFFSLVPCRNKANSPRRNLETPSRSQVGSKNRPSISIRSCQSNDIWVLKKSSICSLTL